MGWLDKPGPGHSNALQPGKVTAGLAENNDNLLGLAACQETEISSEPNGHQSSMELLYFKGFLIQMLARNTRVRMSGLTIQNIRVRTYT